jgi:hypothetical protein
MRDDADQLPLLSLRRFGVMPTKVGIHVFPFRDLQRRGWRACARHDGTEPVMNGAFAPRFSDYAQLARVAEWAAAGGEG